MENGYNKFRKRKSIITMAAALAVLLVIGYLVANGHKKKTLSTLLLANTLSHTPLGLSPNKAPSASGWPARYRLPTSKTSR